MTIATGDAPQTALGNVPAIGANIVGRLKGTSPHCGVGTTAKFLIFRGALKFFTTI
ncbi:MAG: hypothetical protein ACO3NK_16530 [Prochlorotrichaceae cyanobacterium]